MDLLIHWGIKDYEDVTNNYILYDEENLKSIQIIKTSNDIYLLKKKNLLNKHILEIEFELLNYLRKNNFPVQMLIKTVNQANYFQEYKSNTVYCLYEYIKGESLNIDKILQFSDWTIKAGELLGSLHTLLKESPFKKDLQNLNDPKLSIISKTIKKRLINVFNKDLIQNIYEIMPKIEEMEKKFHTLENFLPKQLIHRDFHMGNLIVNKEIDTLIDFDQTCINFKIFDLCYFMVAILNRLCVLKNNEFIINEESFYSILRLLIIGYLKSNTLTKEEKEVFSTMFSLINILFTIYFYDLEEIQVTEESLFLFNWVFLNQKKIFNALY